MTSATPRREFIRCALESHRVRAVILEGPKGALTHVSLGCCEAPHIEYIGKNAVRTVANLADEDSLYRRGPDMPEECPQNVELQL